MSALPIEINATDAKPDKHAIIAAALQGIRDGKSFAQLSQEHHVPPRTIHSWLLGHVPDEYRELQQLGLIARIAEADEDLENASSHLHVARAREIAKFRRWDAERRLSSLFAPKQEIGGPGEFKQVEDRELARRFAYINAMAVREPIDLEVVSEGVTK